MEALYQLSYSPGNGIPEGTSDRTKFLRPSHAIAEHPAHLSDDAVTNASTSRPRGKNWAVKARRSGRPSLRCADG